MTGTKHGKGCCSSEWTIVRHSSNKQLYLQYFHCVDSSEVLKGKEELGRKICSENPLKSKSKMRTHVYVHVYVGVGVSTDRINFAEGFASLFAGVICDVKGSFPSKLSITKDSNLHLLFSSWLQK